MKRKLKELSKGSLIHFCNQLEELNNDLYDYIGYHIMHSEMLNILKSNDKISRFNYEIRRFKHLCTAYDLLIQSCVKNLHTCILKENKKED